MVITSLLTLFGLECTLQASQYCGPGTHIYEPVQIYVTNATCGSTPFYTSPDVNRSISLTRVPLNPAEWLLEMGYECKCNDNAKSV